MKLANYSIDHVNSHQIISFNRINGSSDAIYISIIGFEMNIFAIQFNAQQNEIKYSVHLKN